MKKIAILISCHNRHAKTLSCLTALFASDPVSNNAIEVIVVDDGSTDGTAQLVVERFPIVNIIMGDGNLYWNGGMRMAFTAAMDKGFDYYLWLNDDTLLYPTAIETLINTSRYFKAKQGKDVIVVGSTRDERDGQLTYGGVIRPRKLKPTTFNLIAPRDVPVACDTMNGNCVLLPREVVDSVGNLEEKFAHAMGDLDYGLRARSAGFSIWIMPGFAGTCARNPVTGSFNDASLPISMRLRKMMHPKGLPLSSWRVFTQRHAGFFWPVFWISPYLKVILQGFFKNDKS